MELFTVISIFLAICVVVLTFFKHKYKYWARKGVPFIEPKIPFGTSENMLYPKKSSFEVLFEQYNVLKKSGYKYGGLYLATTPVLTPIDPDLIRNILAKDFNHFQDRGTYVDEKNDPLSAHLFSLEGQKWRNLRVKLTPTFTSGKMKMMFQTLLDCGDQMMVRINHLNERNEPIDGKDVLACFTTDVIGSCAFGLECNSFKDSNSQFRESGRRLFGTNWSRRLRVLMIVASPRLSKKLGIPIFERNLTNFYMDVVKNVVQYREDNSIFRNDFLQILIDLKNNKDENTGLESLTIEEMAAQAFVFFLAGFETSSTLMSFCLFELAQNQEVQERLRKEILDTLKKHGDKITYESLMEMKYLGQVIDETLRKYPPAPTLLRKCVKDYVLADSNIILEKGTRIVISAMGLQNDPEYFPDPEKFDPDRFTEENKANRHPFVYLPFGEGPRICIGLRFGLMQSKVGLALILKDYKVTLNAKTVLPMEFNPNSFLLQPKHNIFLDTEKL